jgi:hypothetical protein
MLTALRSRVHFPAMGLSGFRGPQKSWTVQVPVIAKMKNTKIEMNSKGLLVQNYFPKQ